MPIVPTLSDRVTKFSAKTAPDRVGTRYEASKTIAISRYADAVSPRSAVQEAVRNILETNGVPAGFHGVYYAFAFQVLSKAFSHSGASLVKVVNGLKAKFTAFGADPAILDQITKLFIG
jgi:hypothetical protein